MSTLLQDLRYRSEERRVGKECRSRWGPHHEKKNTSEKWLGGACTQRPRRSTSQSTQQATGESPSSASRPTTRRPTQGSHSSHLHCLFFFSSRRRHTRSTRDWSSDVCSSDLTTPAPGK